MAYTGTNIDFATYIAAFMQIYEGPVGGSYAELVANIWPVEGMTGVYPGLEGAPGMGTWTTGSTLDSLAQGSTDFKITLTNTVFQNAVKYPVDEFTSLANPVFMANIQDLAQKARFHRNQLVAGLLLAGDTTVCEDGQNFFSTTHSYTPTGGSSTNQSNKVNSGAGGLGVAVGSASAITAYEASEIVASAIGYMFGLLDATGFGANGTMADLQFITGNVAAYNALRVAFGQMIIATGTVSVSNPLLGYMKDGFKLTAHLDPVLTGSNKIWAMRGDGIVKPVIIQEKGGIEIITLGPGTEYTRNTNNVLFGAKAVRAAGPGRYQAALEITPTTT